MIDTQYSLAATQAAIPSEPIAPGAAGRSVGTPQAAAELAQAPATRADRVELNAPRQALDPVRMEAAGSELDSSVELLLILFRIAQKARALEHAQLARLLRDAEEIVGKVWAADQAQDSVALRAAGRAFESRNGALQVANTVIQSFVQMANASVQVRQGESQASAREEEVNATIGQSQKQKVEDQMSFDTGFMKDVLQLIQQYTQSHNQAWRAAAGVV